MSTGAFHIYIKPFDDYGDYQTEWTDVTSDVDMDACGSIAIDLDNTEYDIGVYRNSAFKLTLRNEHGKYSEADSAKSIFKYKRADSLVRITWEQELGGAICGIAICEDAYLGEEVVMFEGLLNDDSFKGSLKTQKVDFQILGKESIFARERVPFGTISAGDLLSAVVYACLNQAKVTELLTVSADNISLGIDMAIDSIASLQNKTIQEGLNKLLLVSNSVLYIEDDVVHVAPRTPLAAVSFTFYGQASNLGPENAISIENIKNGLAKTYNFFTWQGTTLSVEDSASVQKYGLRKKELSVEFITDAGKRQDILESLLATFKDPRQEFDILSPLNYESEPVGLRSRVAIDYPAPYLPGDYQLPICGQAICGQAVLPKKQWSFTVDTFDNYWIIGRSLTIKDQSFKFKARLI